MIELREAIATWLVQRYELPATSISADAHVLPVNGSREALFAFAQTVIMSFTHNPKKLIAKLMVDETVERRSKEANLKLVAARNAK